MQFIYLNWSWEYYAKQYLKQGIKPKLPHVENAVPRDEIEEVKNGVRKHQEVLNSSGTHRNWKIISSGKSLQ